MTKIVYIVVLLSVLPSCKKESPVTPPDETSCDFPAGNRSFSWRSDTVAFFPSTLGGIWAFSDNDAYLMGEIVLNDGAGTQVLGLHWDGTRWGRDINGSAREIGCVPNDVTGDGNTMVTVGYWILDSTSGPIVHPGLAEFNNFAKKWTHHRFQTVGALYAVWTDGKGYFLAVGENGTVYSRDGTGGSWTYSKAPTNFHFTSVAGVSKNEIYTRAVVSLVTGEQHTQYWKFNGIQWQNLYDGQDTTNSLLTLPGAEDAMYDVGVYRCARTDSLRLYLIGWESFLLESKGQNLDFRVTNLSQLGLPLRAIQRTGLKIDLFTPKDYWVLGTRYNLYHWNGNSFQRVIIPGLPNSDLQFGGQRRMVKTRSGRVFLPSEIDPQVYAVVQGTP
jgi:hypothetical protein